MGSWFDSGDFKAGLEYDSPFNRIILRSRRWSADDFMEMGLIEKSTEILDCSLNELVMRVKSFGVLGCHLTQGAAVVSFYKELLSIARKKASISEGMNRSQYSPDFHQRFNDRFDAKIFETSLLISDLIRHRLFGSLESAEGIKLVRFEEIDRIPVEYSILVELASVIPRIGLACLAPIAFILVESMKNVTRYSRLSRAMINGNGQTQAKLALLNLVFERASKHFPCCFLFADIICLQIAFFSLATESFEWAIKTFIARPSQEGLVFAATPSKNLIIACSSTRLLEDHRLARLVLENKVNNSSGLSKYYFVVLGQGPVIFDMIAREGVLVKKLSNGHPFVAVREAFQLEHRLIVVAQSHLTINYFISTLEIGRRFFLDPEFMGLGSFNSGHGQGFYRKAIREAGIELCHELFHIVQLVNENDEHSDALDSSIAATLELVEYTLTRAIYWPPSLLFLLRHFVERWVFWMQMHAKFYISPPSPELLVWSVTWALKVSISLMTISNCQLIPVSVISPEELDILHEGVYRVYISKQPPPLIKEEHGKIIQVLESLLAHYRKTASPDGTQSLVNPTKGRYQIFSPLSIGGKAKVFKAFDFKVRNLVVIKQIAASPAAEEEFRILATLDHINIVRHLDCFRIDDLSFLVMEYCDGSTLRLWRKRWASVEIAEQQQQRKLMIRRIARQILVGLSYLHTHHIVHRDIKPENIFLTATGKVKIGDFGEATQVSDNITEIKASPQFDLYQLHGTISYMAPESLHASTVSTKADIWSFGCLLGYLFTGKAPWATFDDSMAILFQLGLGHQLPFDLDEMECSPACKDIIRLALCYDPEKRPRAVDLLGMDYFSSI